MPCQIETALGVKYTFQLNPLQVQITLQAEEGDWRSLRGGHYNGLIGPYPERITMRVDCPALRGSFPNSFKQDLVQSPDADPNAENGINPDGTPVATVATLVPDHWMDPQEYIHPLQNAIRQARGRVFITMPECDIYNWYLCVSITETHQGGYGDLGLDLEFAEERRIQLLTQADLSTQSSGDGSEDPPKSDETDTHTDPNTGAAVGGDVNDGTPQPGQTYTIQSGDTLSSIAQRAYDDPDKYVDIYNANTDVLDPDPSKVTAGTQIQIP
jgi:hypothetical protein